MGTDQKSTLIHMDMRGPSRPADCFDCIVAFPTAVEKMRAMGGGFDLMQDMLSGAQAAFGELKSSDKNGLLFVASASQDLLYRYIAQLTILDEYTRVYCSSVVRYFFRQLSKHHIRTFYILDNTLREDRFQAILELFELAGIVVVTPRRDGVTWKDLAARLRDGLRNEGHVAYIEPDAQVNHLDAARQFAKELLCIATFRNLAPDDPEHSIINFQIDAN